LCGRRWHDLSNDRCRERGQPAEAVLLPGGNDGADSSVVLDRGPGGSERESAPGALATAGDRPRGRRSTPRAERALESRQRDRAARAHGRARPRADDTEAREEEIEQHEPRAGKAGTSAPASPPSGLGLMSPRWEQRLASGCA
jgi:hypothetical protein